MDNYGKLIAKTIFEDFDHEVNSNSERFQNSDRVVLAKELAVLRIYEILIALGSVHKDSQKGQLLENQLIDESGVVLVKNNYFKNTEEFSQFLSVRLSQYKEDMKKNPKPWTPGPYWIAKDFCFALECFNPEIIRQTIANFAEAVESYVKMIREIEEIADEK